MRRTIGDGIDASCFSSCTQTPLHGNVEAVAGHAIDKGNGWRIPFGLSFTLFRRRLGRFGFAFFGRGFGGCCVAAVGGRGSGRGARAKDERQHGDQSQ